MTQLIKYNERPLFEGLSRLENLFSGDWAALDVQENDDHVDVVIDLPGVDKGDIEINYENDLLDIKAWREQEASEGRKSERSWGSIRRTVSLPGVHADQAQATLEGGVLRISFPRAQAPRGQRIEIE